ncbi:AAA family ATPase [Levilactobacillus brevis]|uniref:AAA family ATPase n=1 Tax=Levilactobacillus brevis TaxID=1580 RepID=UPI0031E23FCC
MSKITVLEVDMKIKEISLKNIGNISGLSLNLNEHMNVICGTNGIGKTTILRAVKSLFDNSESDLKKKYGTDQGTIVADLFDGHKRRLNIDSVLPSDENKNYSNSEYFFDLANEIIVNPDSRNLEYKSLRSMSRYPDRKSNRILGNSQFLKNTVGDTLKDWLLNRIAASGSNDDLSEAERYNIQKMKETFSVIDSKIKYKMVDWRTFEVLLNDNGNEVYLEFESTGFKNILFIILGIMEEIEFRFNDLKIDEFDGIILIDEVELHLHPAWQDKIIGILKQMFPKAQFIITTHSPAVLQSLDKDEIIPLSIDDGDVDIKRLDLSEYGLKGWTLEEILSDVMGVGELKNKVLRDALDGFSTAIDDNNVETAKKEYEKLNVMLHPKSQLRQILQIQKAGLF